MLLGCGCLASVVFVGWWVVMVGSVVCWVSVWPVWRDAVADPVEVSGAGAA